MLCVGIHYPFREEADKNLMLIAHTCNNERPHSMGSQYTHPPLVPKTHMSSITRISFRIAPPESSAVIPGLKHVDLHSNKFPLGINSHCFVQ